MEYVATINGRETHVEHHGIKGMHWGIRRFQNYDGTRIRSRTQVANVDHEKDTHPDVVKGTRIYRTSKNESDLGRKKNELYVTYDEERDRNLYLQWNPYKRGEKMVEQYLEPVKDLKIASLNTVAQEAYSKYGSEEKIAKTVVETKIGLLSKSRGIDKQTVMEWDGKDYSPNSKAVTRAIKNGFMVDEESPSQKPSRSDVADKLNYVLNENFSSLIYDKAVKKQVQIYKQNPQKCYMDAAIALGGDKKHRASVERALEKQGYDGMVDALGTLGGRGLVKNYNRKIKANTVGYEGRDPLIIFSPDKNLKTRGRSRAITQQMREKAVEDDSKAFSKDTERKQYLTDQQMQTAIYGGTLVTLGVLRMLLWGV